MNLEPLGLTWFVRLSYVELLIFIVKKLEGHCYVLWCKWKNIRCLNSFSMKWSYFLICLISLYSKNKVLAELMCIRLVGLVIFSFYAEKLAYTLVGHCT